MRPKPEDIQALVERIVRECDPEQVILFGSTAYGEARADSDVDLLVVLPFEGTPFRKTFDILSAVRPSFPVDLLVRRPDDFQRRLALGDPLVCDAVERGRVLYRKAA